MSLIAKSKSEIGIHGLVELAAGRAAQADEARTITGEVMDAISGAGFTRWFTPEQRGGSPRSFAELTSAVAGLSEACASTGWLASLFAFATRYVGCFPEEAQVEVWGDNPDARVVAVVKPLGAAAREEGGWRLSGSWTYASGAEFADWAILAGPAPSAESTGPPQFFLVPRSDCTILDTWQPLGMRATASHTIVLDNVFVPAHRACVREAAMNGTASVLGGAPVPTSAVNGLTFVVPALGAARGALAAAKNGVLTSPTGPRAAAGQAYQVEFARAAGEIDAAQLLLERVADVADDNTSLTPNLVRRSRRDAALALEMLVSAADRLLRTGGTRGQEDSHPLQRCWRDVRSVAGHAVVQFEPAALEYTQSLAEP